MTNVILVNYFKENLSKGYTSQQLIDALVEQGYNLEDINEALNEVYKNNSLVSTESNGKNKFKFLTIISIILILTIIGGASFLFLFQNKDVSKNSENLEIDVDSNSEKLKLDQNEVQKEQLESNKLMYFCEDKETKEYIYKYNKKSNTKYKYNWGFDISIYDGEFLYSQNKNIWTKTIPNQKELENLEYGTDIDRIKEWMECYEILLDETKFEKPYVNFTSIDETINEIKNNTLNSIDEQIIKDLSNEMGREMTKEDIIEIYGEEGYEELRMMYEQQINLIN